LFIFLAELADLSLPAPGPANFDSTELGSIMLGELRPLFCEYVAAGGLSMCNSITILSAKLHREFVKFMGDEYEQDGPILRLPGLVVRGASHLCCLLPWDLYLELLATAQAGVGLTSGPFDYASFQGWAGFRLALVREARCLGPNDYLERMKSLNIPDKTIWACVKGSVLQILQEIVAESMHGAHHQLPSHVDRIAAQWMLRQWQKQLLQNVYSSGDRPPTHPIPPIPNFPRLAPSSCPSVDAVF